ncbi:hypothetical protein IWX85_002933 [Polaromonas sp. CG_9.11]|nr:hypothetical protein [Polaromonas sp. CG_9.11]
MQALLRRDGRIALGAEFAHGIRNGIVQATVQGSVFVDAERRIPLEGQVGDGLAEVAIVMHDLVHTVAKVQQRLAMRRRSDPHFRQPRDIAARRAGNLKADAVFIVLLGFQCPGQLVNWSTGQLVDEHRDAVFQLLHGSGPLWSFGDFFDAPGNQVVAIVG